MGVHVVCKRISAAGGEGGEVRAMSVGSRDAVGLRLLFDDEEVSSSGRPRCGEAGVLESSSLVARGGGGGGGGG
ncbi:MAG: hypothetical protein ACTJLK_04710, partial [Anaplasma sp.]